MLHNTKTNNNPGDAVQNNKIIILLSNIMTMRNRLMIGKNITEIEYEDFHVNRK